MKTPLDLVAFALATSDPEKRWRRFMAFYLSLLVSALLVVGAAVVALLYAPDDSVLSRVLFTALGMGAAGAGIVTRKISRGDYRRHDSARPEPADGTTEGTDETTTNDDD